MITDYAIKFLLTYLKNGKAHNNGFCNYFDIGYVDNGDWVSILTSKIHPKTVRFDDSQNPSRIICEGRIPPSKIITEGVYDDIDFEIRIYDTLSGTNDNGDNTCVAIVPMSDIVENYFRSELSSTVEVILQWEISFERGE